VRRHTCEVSAAEIDSNHQWLGLVDRQVVKVAILNEKVGTILRDTVVDESDLVSIGLVVVLVIAFVIDESLKVAHLLTRPNEGLLRAEALQ